MSLFKIEASSLIKAPAPLVYAILADYRDGHPHILPKPYFISLEVEQGGYGEGTIISFQMRVLGRTLTFRSAVTEPEPGRVLVETNLEENGAVTSFLLTPSEHERYTEVKIMTEGKLQRSGMPGRLESLITRKYLRRVYLRELDLLNSLAQQRFASANKATSA